MPERATPDQRRSEKSAEAVVAAVRRRRAKREEEHEASGIEGAGPQMSIQMELPFENRGEAPRVERSVEASTAPGGELGTCTCGPVGRVSES